MSQASGPPYHRPNQKWLCTHPEGCGCPGGPTSTGTCGGHSDCNPIQIGDTWSCNRPAHRGGACEKGPDADGKCCRSDLHCVPRRSLRSKRKIFVVSCVALITGILLIGIWSPNRNEFLAPGGLSSGHAQIWSGKNGADRCAACHAAGSVDPVAWVSSLFSTDNAIMAIPQHQKCLECHAEMLPSETALLVHNLPVDRLTDLKSKHASLSSEGSLRNSLFATPVNHAGEIACANCHREHHGKEHDLKAMTDLQCQSCHQNQFQSFEDNHPEFTTLLRPQSKQSTIAFDHYSHQAKYFTKAGQSFDCQSCHQSDEQGNIMQTASFESSCASCHDKTIEASTMQGVPVFSLPMIDRKLLRQYGLKVGEWPEAASGEFDGQLPDLMKVLLSTDPRAKEAMNFLGNEFDFFDLDPDNLAHLKAAFDIAIASKSLMYDLSTQGQVALETRLKMLGEKAPSTIELRRMMGKLSADTFLNAQRDWFPNIHSEIDQLRQQTDDIPLKPLNLNRDTKVTPVSYTEFFESMYREPDASPSSESPTDPPQESDLLAENPLEGIFAEQTGSADSDSNSTANTYNSAAPPTAPSTEASGQLNEGIEFDALPPLTTDSIPSEIGPTQIVEQETVVTPPVGSEIPPRGVQQISPLRPAQKVIKNPYVDTDPLPIPGEMELSPVQPDNTGAGPVAGDQAQSSAKPANPTPSIESQTVGSEQQITQKLETQDDDLLAENPLANRVDNKAESKQESDRSSANPTSDPAKQQITKTPGETNQNSTESKATESKATESKVADATSTNNAKLPDEKTSSPQVGLAKGDVEGTGELENNSSATENSLQNSAAATSKRTRKQPKPRSVDEIAAIEKVALGGWYHDDKTLTIGYRPTGHADELIRGWLEYTSRMPTQSDNIAIEDFRNAMEKPDAIGQCNSCHQHQLEDDLSLVSVWTSQHRDTGVRGFTRFSHRPHLVQATADQCVSCHQIAPTPIQPTGLMTSSSGTQTIKQRCGSGLAPINKSNCTPCHNNASRIQNCTQCHNYHVGTAIEKLDPLSGMFENQ